MDDAEKSRYSVPMNRSFSPEHQAFSEQVAMKFRLYSGLFHDLPFPEMGETGHILPMFARVCREQLELGLAPDSIVEGFFRDKLGLKDANEIQNRLFTFMQLAERQVALFDAVEDATFHLTRNMDGAGSLRDVLSRIEAANAQGALRELLKTFGVRIVLTAHPTQFYTDHVLGILQSLRKSIQKNDVREVWRLLLQLGRTRFKKKEKPSPFDEAKSVLWFMEHVLYDVVPEVHQRLAFATGLSPEECLAIEPSVDLGFWPGGDRDGNPFVTVAVTRRVAALVHDSLVRLYLRDLDGLRQRLTFDGAIEALDLMYERLLARITPVPSSSESLAKGLYCVEPDTNAYQNAEELISDLMSLRTLLINDHAGLFVEYLESFVVKVRCFGFRFGSIDLRQDSRIISRAVDEVLSRLIPDRMKPGAYLALEPEKRLSFLTSLDDSVFSAQLSKAGSSIEDPVLVDLLEVFALAREVQKSNGERGLHRFIISNTRNTANILEVRLLALLSQKPGEDSSIPAVPFDIVPLFETVDDLEEARTMMKQLWELPRYRSHLQERSGVQHIMLGFSDGTKDGGYLTANWYIYRAKQALSSLGREAGVQVIFFDGRGGPPARGGGNTHKFYRSLGPDIESRAIDVTIQGQTISSMYGQPDSARYNLEQLVSAVLDNNLRLSDAATHSEWDLSEKDALTIQDLSDLSYEHYLAFRQDPTFMLYLQELSPLSYYAQANISSRPAKRAGNSALTLDDLRAIPFVGAWSQLKQNIPGHFGLGTAISTLIKADRLGELQSLYRRSLYFRTLLENSMQSLSKVYLPLTAYLKDDPEFGTFWQQIADEVQRGTEGLLAVSSQSELLGQDPLNRDSIRMREDLIVPMAVIQQFALLKLRGHRGAAAGPQSAPRFDKAALEKMVIKSMAVCVNASRNSV